MVTHPDNKSTVSLFVDDVPAGSIELGKKINVAPKSNALNIGRNWGAAVNSDFKSPFYFTGSIFKACIDVER